MAAAAGGALLPAGIALADNSSERSKEGEAFLEDL